jgi:hypothetical protein
MNQIIGYSIIAVFAIGLILFVGKYLLSLGKKEEVTMSFDLGLYEDELNPKSDLKLEVVKADPEPKKKAAKKTKSKKPSAKKKTKNTKNTVTFS